MANLGARLRHLRRERGCTLQEVSDGSGLTPSFLSRLERGIVNISVGNLRKVASFFGVPITHFFTEELVPRGIVIRASARRVDELPKDHVRRASLLPDEAGHLGAEGQLACSLGSQVMRLSPGDVLYQRRPVALHWSNEGGAAMVLVVSLQTEER
jgi:transcriptional regulator with XRE-family HTH domain